MPYLAYLGEATCIAIVAVFIFGGGIFTFTLMRFWLLTLVQNHRRRIHARQVLDNCTSPFIEHY